MYTSTSSSFVSTSKKAIFAGLISATVAGATLIGAASPALASTRGWIHEGNTWSYQVSKDTYAKGWYYTPSGKWFYFNKDNYKMVTGKLTDDHKDYWLDENAGLLYDRWVQDAKGNWLHTDDNGVLVTGWFKTKSGYWFYFNQDHTMKTGILTDKGYTFWLDKNDGLLYNEWVKDESGNWLRTDGNGCLLTGWYHAPNGKWFYFNKDSYQMVTGKLTDDHKDYWLDENAGLLYDRWVQDAKGNWLHTDDNGVLVTGWFKTKSGYWFYFNQDHTMKTGILTDKGYTFWLDKNDGLLYNEWVKDESGNWLRTDGNGCLLTGWYHAPNGKWFYFNDDHTLRTEPLVEKGNRYYFDVNMGLIRTEPLTQGSESANKPSSSSTGKILGTDKNNKPCGATRWVVDKPAWKERTELSLIATWHGCPKTGAKPHQIITTSRDPNDWKPMVAEGELRAWQTGKLLGISKLFHKPYSDLSEEQMKEDILKYRPTTLLAQRHNDEVCAYQSLKIAESNYTETVEEKTVEHPEQGHWE